MKEILVYSSEQNLTIFKEPKWKIVIFDFNLFMTYKSHTRLCYNQMPISANVIEIN